MLVASGCQSDDACSTPRLQQQPAGYSLCNKRGCPERALRLSLQVKPALATVEKAQPSESFARVDYTPSLESAINEQACSRSPVLFRVPTVTLFCCTDRVPRVPQINIEYNIR